MGATYALAVLVILLVAFTLNRLYWRLELSRAKHPSLQGHSKMARRVARWVPFYEFQGDALFNCDGAPESIAQRRREGFQALSARLRGATSESGQLTSSLEQHLSDTQFINSYRVPFQFRSAVRDHLMPGMVADASAGTRIRDIDGHWHYDLSGSYGVNVFGYDFYKSCIDEGVNRVRNLGPVLGTYHPLVLDNVERIKDISGLDEVSFHMSGTEAVMQATRLARYHTGRSHLVRFCGAYHGWWDGVQPGIGTQRAVNDVYTLKDMDQQTLRVLRTRTDIACVLVSPFQALHPNGGAPGDATLVNSDRHCAFDPDRYGDWLRRLREVCTQRGIVLIFDEVFSGFRIAYGGAQEYFGVQADMVTYGKTLGGGLPVGVLCGQHHLMKRFRDDRPTDVCFARGTFNAHPYVMASMNVFLERIQDPSIRRVYRDMRALWDRRVEQLNHALELRQLPVRVVNLVSIWSVIYSRPGRYNWLFQFYLRAEGLHLSWTGTGRLIFSHNYTDEDFDAVQHRFIAAASSMEADGWWWNDGRLTNKRIKKQILREMLGCWLRGRGGAGRHAPAAGSPIPDQ
ncbi:glutamate-1-semialdehyde 2,1-aminomutase [Halovibrio salipaludis]|uniref:Glutamate-1-semialdehyde 2,1-aminomutase n=1 Tax=Halovibrio salipaludis TaxID=2032626 RepID=A0A2A2F4P7_9GAMM|nr:aminotransferase class III-fold pyridoxal phosphate-dependent enzyme [Halovibrio salipaludis]PAU79647.1 glutamate-1-semialdehyde 2,1-aminomutase [Halovibrio salipaludis]